jgi:hypothetical protein
MTKATLMHIENGFNMNEMTETKADAEKKIAAQLAKHKRSMSLSDVAKAEFVKKPIADPDFWGFGSDSPSIVDGVKLHKYVFHFFFF